MSYSWSPATGLDNANSANPVATPTQTTTYTVTATDLSGATAVTDQITITVNGTAGIEENSQSNFNMFPNPSNGFVTISTTQIGGTIKIADATGRIISTKTISTENTMIDLDQHISGVYFVSILGADGTSTTKKLIVRK